MKKSTKKTNRGFVILFAVTVSAILLSIALGVTNIAQQEVKFNTSAKDTNSAFFAADTGIECAEINDKTNPNFFPAAGPAVKITCASSTANNITPVFTSASNSYDFVVSGLGGDGKSCAKVNIRKIVNADSSVATTITSKGYNVGDETCSSTDKNRVERELQVTYTAGSSSVIVGPIVFTNNSFETPALGTGFQYSPSGAGWSFVGAGIQGNGSAWGATNAPDGTQTAFIQGTGSISQTATMNAGSYTLSFKVARRSSQLQPIRVSIGGNQVGSLISPSGNSFEQVNIPVVISTTGSYALKMEGTDGVGDKSTFVDIVTMIPN